MNISTEIKQRIKDADRDTYHANDCIADYICIEEGELIKLQQEVAEKVESLLSSLIIDTFTDHNTQETATRVAKMFIQEVMRGRYNKLEELKTFPNTKKLDEMILVGPIKVRSMCSHHLVPIMGECFIGVIPGDKLFGLSKFNRLCDWIMSRPQIQEEATVQIADLIEELLNPMGVAVYVRAMHMCMAWRGVKDDNALATTSVLRGVFAKNPTAKQEFFELIKSNK